MSSQRYERVYANEDHDNQTEPQQHDADMTSPPPSFRSRTSSINPHHVSSEQDGLIDQTLAETFNSPSDDDSDDEDTRRLDDRQRVISGRPEETHGGDNSATLLNARPPAAGLPITEPPVSAPASTAPRPHGGGNAVVHDGVFANLNAKSQPGEELEEKPPTYEQAAADAAPPYWETTILTNGSSSPDDVYVDGLPVGSLFSFLWNGTISMSFQLVGFLLTYLLHTTHAAKHGSKAGLGITLVKYGFSMRGDSSKNKSPDSGGGTGPGAGADFAPPPGDPNNHVFDPNAVDAVGFVAAEGPVGGGVGGGGLSSLRATDWFAYALMIVGWFILIRAISEYLRARRHEQLVLQSPARGLGTPVVAEGEAAETTV